MTELKHTPGPWKATRRGIMALNPMTGRYSLVVCQPNWRGVEPDDVWLDTPREANARLIAAAPDLLEACKAFCRKVEAGEAKSTRSYAQMKAAIAKAEGITQ